MNLLLKLFAKVPVKARVAVLALLSLAGFVLSFDGFDEGRIGEGICGLVFGIVAVGIVGSILGENADL